MIKKFISKKVFIVIGLIFQVTILIMLVKLFSNERATYHFPYDKLDMGNSILLTEFNGNEGGLYLDNSLDYEDTVIQTPGMNLSKGSYQITVNYEVGEDGQTYSITCDNATYKIMAGHTGNELDKSKTSTVFNINLDRDIANFKLYFNYNGNGYLLVRDISINQTNEWNKIILCNTFFFFIILDLLIWFFLCKKYKSITLENKQIVFSIALITLFASYPLSSFYLFKGHDLTFHLLRIEGIKEGLLAGQFPVKMQPTWLDGSGYGVSVFYGDLLLYVPALLRLIGYSVQSAYKVYIVLINLATCLGAYYCFSKIAGSKKIGLLTSCAYTLSIYRLTCIYIRAAVGEYSAMLFLPFIAYGLYIIFKEKGDKCKAGIAPAVLGYTGLIQTHILSCEMVGLLTIILCVMMSRQIVNKYRFISLVKVVLYTIVINLWFLIPFLDYMRGNISVNMSSDMKIQTFGAFGNQLLSFFPNTSGSGLSTLERLEYADTMPLTVGVTFIVAGVLFLYNFLDTNKKNEQRHERLFGIGCLLGGGILLWMTTIWFPWDNLAGLGNTIRFFIQKLQFPWRFLGPATLLFSMVLICLLKINLNLNQSVYKKIYIGISITAIVSCGWFLSSLVSKNNVTYVTDLSMLDTYVVVSGEYKPVGAKIGRIADKPPIISDNLSVSDYSKIYNVITLFCDNQSETEGSIDLPLLYYKGYEGVTDKEDPALTVMANDYGGTRVIIPKGFCGDILVQFTEPWYWRMGELVSLLFIILLCCIRFNKFRLNKGEKLESKT